MKTLARLFLYLNFALFAAVMVYAAIEVFIQEPLIGVLGLWFVLFFAAAMSAF